MQTHMTNRCAILCAVLVVTAMAAPSGTVQDDGYVFDEGEAPRCIMGSGDNMIVQYNAQGDKAHPSWKCEHNVELTSCVCTMNHPTHHDGGCREMVHKGKSHHIAGTCTDAGKSR